MSIKINESSIFKTSKLIEDAHGFISFLFMTLGKSTLQPQLFL